MKGRLIALLTVISVAVAGCGSYTPPSVVTQILSDPVYDGYISQASGTTAYTVTQGSTQSVFAGVDPGTYTEYRGFVDFPLSGYSGVPLDAVITSATLDIFINYTPQTLTGTIPIRLDLVYFQPPILDGSYFDLTWPQPPLATVTTSVSQADLGKHVYVDVSSLMAEAQYLGLPDCQIRIVEDPSYRSPGLIQINDTTTSDRSLLAPLLQVTYY